jgi:hypothetical protein
LQWGIRNGAKQSNPVKRQVSQTSNTITTSTSDKIMPIPNQLKLRRKINAVINPLTRAPIIQSAGSGKNASSNPTARNLRAVRNPLARALGRY